MEDPGRSPFYMGSSSMAKAGLSCSTHFDYFL
jgi:hypothetical protein